MKTNSSRSTSLIGTARSLWRAQVSISGGPGPALRYAIGRARSIGFVRLLALFSSHARGPVSDAVEDDIPDGENICSAAETAKESPAECRVPVVPEGWAGYGKLSAELSAPAQPAKCSPLALLDLPAHRLAAVLEKMRFPACEPPLVSIVMPVHNQLKYTVECLQALLDTDDHSVAYEIVLADDASTEPGVERLGQLENVRYFRNETNVGFLRTCNRAAGEARGRYLLFLNNDTQIRRGAIRALVDVFAECPDAGAVGPKVLYPSGHLQEAGGVVQGDLTTEMVGLNDDPDRPCYNVRRPVDYCSGVCLLIERETFHSLGGFSDELAPAYYEDVDLCLKVRKAGRQVYYEPRAVIVHHLSKSHAGSGDGAKLALIARNRQRMVEKWQGFVDAAAQMRLIAFYLPQYHPIPENDLWWGKGFTEWRNVAAATPVFDGHIQPRLPGKLGFYDLRVPEIMEQQADLARRYGVHGFCFYYYWFGGKRLLELPLERMLASGRPDFPFCLCWANENWTRRWDGQDQEMLISQAHSPEDDEAIIRDLIRYMRDPRYIRIGGRPLLLVYRTSLLPDIRQTGERWRRVCRDEGLGEICLAAVESFGGDLTVDPATYGFDFTVAFPPHGTPYRNSLSRVKLRREALLYPYLDMVRHAVGQEVPHLKRFLGVCPGWDNTPRRKSGSTIFAHATPGEYQAWLEWALRQTRRWRQGDQRMVFINAWNEWGEGAMLEPDASYGPANLEATRNALFNVTVH